MLGQQDCRCDTSGSFPRPGSLHTTSGDGPELQRPAAWAGLNTPQVSGLLESPWSSFCLVRWGNKATRLMGNGDFWGQEQPEGLG